MEDGQSTIVQQSNDQITTDVHTGKQPTPAIADERNEEIWSRVMEIRRVQTMPMDDQLTSIGGMQWVETCAPLINSEIGAAGKFRTRQQYASSISHPLCSSIILDKKDDARHERKTCHEGRSHPQVVQ